MTTCSGDSKIIAKASPSRFLPPRVLAMPEHLGALERNMSALTTIFDNDDFSYFVEIEPTFWDEKTGYTLAIYSRWRGAKKPSAAQQQFLACLDRQGLENLGQLINEQLRKYKSEYPAEDRMGLKAAGEFNRRISAIFRNGVDLSGQETP
jgi:hypothetical protein